MYMYIGPPDDDDGNGGTDGSGEDCSSFSHEPKRSQYQEGNKRPEIVEMAAGSADVLSQSRALSSTGFVVAVDKDGGVWSWGEGRFGQLGHGDVEERLYPTRVEALRGVGIRWSAAGGRHSALVSEAGVVWTAGAGREGQLGHGGVSLQSSSTFQRVDDLLCGRAVTRVCVCVCVCGGGEGRGDWGGFCNPPPPPPHTPARAAPPTHTPPVGRGGGRPPPGAGGGHSATPPPHTHTNTRARTHTHTHAGCSWNFPHSCCHRCRTHFRVGWWVIRNHGDIWNQHTWTGDLC